MVSLNTELGRDTQDPLPRAQRINGSLIIFSHLLNDNWSVKIFILLILELMLIIYIFLKNYPFHLLSQVVTDNGKNIMKAVN